ncbi:hypothetical protein [Labrenzia sp. PHM005]|uniref:hypothetical protein n=1 Tax=Labrenzia sp. PHM005 TaxID=2590016 RepID=UPI0011405E5A|nr:hypothetical protein [Labrenzia sp. PHM005]QDG76725.1 hypothetical protein FJ695_13050 [Labrenzia sp. PHM005]
MARKASQPGPANVDDPKTSGADVPAGKEPLPPPSATGASSADAGAANASLSSENQNLAGKSKTADPAGTGQPAAAEQVQQGGHTSGRGTPSSDLLKQILEGFLKTSTLQTDYQTLYRSLPAVVGIAAEIMKKKEAGDTALDEGMQAVERVLGDARDKAEQLSTAMSAQQAALEELLNNKASLTDLLKASQQQTSDKIKGLPHLGFEAAALADPKVAYQLNTLMGNINAMVSREVERQLSVLRNKVASVQQSGNPQK